MAKRPLKPEESRAWARVARSVRVIDPGREVIEEALEKPLTKSPSKPAKQQQPPAAPRSSRKVAERMAQLADRGGERRVRRGKLEIAASFDLHGHTQASAAAALPGFLRQQRGSGARCVLVITGKGKTGEGVLKRNFLRWLETQDARALVSGYAMAHRKHGGSGAFYVFLRKMPK